MTSRIRCSCGRVYDPQKHTHCPECGAESPVESVVVAEKPKPPAPVVVKPEATKEQAEGAKREGPQVDFGQIMKAIPWPVFAGGAAVLVLLVIIFAARHRGPGGEQASNEKERPTPVKEEKLSPVPGPSASASAQPSINPTVAPVGPTPVFAGNLSDVIGKAAEGATVKLPAGVYQGGAVISRPVHIVGETANGAQVFVQGDSKDTISVRSKGVVIETVQVMFNGTGDAAAISVVDSAELEMAGAKVLSTSSNGLNAGSGASVKATGSSFTVANGTAVSFDRQSRGNFTQCNFTDSQTAIKLANASSVELHGCGFERDGTRGGRGAIMTVAGDKTQLTADQCRFASNPAGIDATDAALLSISNSAFNDNGVSSVQPNWTGGLIQVKSAAAAKLEGDTFESNGQGVLATNGGSVEVDKCRFTGNGLQTRGELILGCMSVAGNGQGTTVTIRNSAISTSASYGVACVGNARCNLEETEISGARTVGLLVGDRRGLPAVAEAKHCHFTRNTTGVGVCAGSTATISDSDCRENSEGALALDRGTRLNLNKSTIVANRQHGVCVYGGAIGNVVDSQIENNVRGAQSGMQKKTTMAASLTLQNCRVAGNQTFGVGACAKSQLVLTRVTFEGNGKTNIYRESGAIVQSDNRLTGEAQTSADDSSDQEATDDQGSPTPAKKQKRSDDTRTILKRIFRPN